MKLGKATKNLIDLIQNKKESLQMKSYRLEDFIDEFKTKRDFITQVKIDGEFTLLYINGDDIKFISPTGRYRIEFPLWEEVKKNFSNYKETYIYGELYCVDKKEKMLPYNLALSIMRKPTKETEKQIRFSVFDIDKLNGEDFTNNSYEVRYNSIIDLFSDFEYIHPAMGEFCNDIKCVKKMWDEWVIKKEYEGLVVRHNDKIYKIKEQFSIDLVVIGATQSSSGRKEIGALLTALVNENNELVESSHVGTGFTQQMREEWWYWTQKNKIKQIDNIIYVKPIRVIEVKGEQYYKSLGKKFDKNYNVIGKDYTITIRKPVFVRIREDKKPNKKTVGLSQVPEKKLIEKIKAYHPVHKDTIIIEPNEYYKDGLTELDIYNWFYKHMNEMLKYFKGRNVALVKKIDDTTIFQRKLKGKYITIENKETFDMLNNGRVLEFHPILKKKEKYGFIDIDPKSKVDFEYTKKITKDLYNFIRNKYNDLEVRYSGGNGFHIYIYFNKEKNIDEIREMLKKDLREFIDDNDKLTIGIAKSNQIRLDVSTLHYMGSLRSLYSIHKYTGLYCAKIDPNEILKLKKENYKIR